MKIKNYFDVRAFKNGQVAISSNTQNNIQNNP